MKKTLKHVKTSHVPGLARNNLGNMAILLIATYRFNVIPIKTKMSFFHRITRKGKMTKCNRPNIYAL
jgi:hypothetical protein